MEKSKTFFDEIFASYYAFVIFFIYFLFLSDEGPMLESQTILSVLAVHRSFYISICAIFVVSSGKKDERPERRRSLKAGIQNVIKMHSPQDKRKKPKDASKPKKKSKSNKYSRKKKVPITNATDVFDIDAAAVEQEKTSKGTLLGKLTLILTTDLKNKTGSSIYCWKTEVNGGHIGVTT